MSQLLYPQTPPQIVACRLNWFIKTLTICDVIRYATKMNRKVDQDNSKLVITRDDLCTRSLSWRLVILSCDILAWHNYHNNNSNINNNNTVDLTQRLTDRTVQLLSHVHALSWKQKRFGCFHLICSAMSALFIHFGNNSITLVIDFDLTCIFACNLHGKMFSLHAVNRFVGRHFVLCLNLCEVCGSMNWSESDKFNNISWEALYWFLFELNSSNHFQSVIFLLTCFQRCNARVCRWK